MATAIPRLDMISSEHIVGANVFDPSGKEIGEIDHLMIDPATGQARYADREFLRLHVPAQRPSRRAVEHALLRPGQAPLYDRGDRASSSRTRPNMTRRAGPIAIGRRASTPHYGAAPYWESAAR